MLIKWLLDIKVEIVIYQMNKQFAFLVVFCIYAEEIKSSLIKYHIQKNILLLLHKEHHQKKNDYVRFTNSVENTIYNMDNSMEKK